jgi:hypothetical protein
MQVEDSRRRRKRKVENECSELMKKMSGKE